MSMELDARMKAACRVGDVEEMEKCLGMGAEVDHIDASEEKGNVTGLWLAAEAGKLDAVELLLSRQADLSFQRKKDGASVLYVACQNGHADVVEHILGIHGFDGVNVAKTNGNTPLLIAAQQGYLPVARLLLAHGADTNARNETNVTAFMLACFVGHADIAVLLLEAGSDHTQEGGGKTGLEWAKARNNKAVVAAVHHYLRIVAKLTLSDEFVKSLFYQWMGAAQARLDERAAAPSEPAEEHVEEEEAASAPPIDAPLFPKYEPFVLPKDNNGERLRRADVPSTILSGSSGGALAAADAAARSAAVGGEGTESTLQPPPSLGGGDVARWGARPKAASPTYLHRVEAAYECEFGGYEKTGDWRSVMAADARNSTRARESLKTAARTPPPAPAGTPGVRTPHSRQAATMPPPSTKESRTRVAVDSCFRALFPDEEQRAAVQGKYEAQHVLLSRPHRAAAREGARRRDPPRAGGNPVLLSGIHHAPKVSEYMNMRTGVHNQRTAVEKEWGRKTRRSVQDAQEKAQQAAEKKALRAATALAVTSQLEHQVLSGELHDPGLRARINRFECTSIHGTAARSRNVTCSEGYRQFHAKYSTVPGEF
eukprot:TRINITY_DN13593_c0_g1_i1.p1 TRINITY_DN13593_c0_g1~~TRINITY_DN13593_c0_g1_i1.p1  ORF type:complete len:619 (+),score=196.59 TRINITY_DN13593_c0_g1_i1:65-1858(+)